MKPIFNKKRTPGVTNEDVINFYDAGHSIQETAAYVNLAQNTVSCIVFGYNSYRYLKPVEEIGRFTKRKRESLGIFIKSNKLSGGRDHINELVRERDNHECQKCHKKWEEGTRRFDVHHMDEHMDGKSHFRGILNYNRTHLNRLTTLCHKCHFNLDITRKRISKRLSPVRKRNALD